MDDCTCRRCLLHDDPGGCLKVRYMDASELRFPPGRWPETICPDGAVFRRAEVVTEDGEVACVTYRGPNGYRVVVFND